MVKRDRFSAAEAPEAAVLAAQIKPKKGQILRPAVKLRKDAGRCRPGRYGKPPVLPPERGVLKAAEHVFAPRERSPVDTGPPLVVN